MTIFAVQTADGATLQRLGPDADTPPTPNLGEVFARSAALPRPLEAHEHWDFDAGEIVFDLTALRAARWEEVKAKRQMVQFGGCMTPSGRVQTDADSQRLINGAVTLAMLSLQAQAPFALSFTLADNSTVILSAAQMIAMGQAVGVFIGLAHAQSLALRAALEAATSRAEVEAVDVNAGWPA